MDGREHKDITRIAGLRGALELIAEGSLTTDHGYWSATGTPAGQLARARGIAESALKADNLTEHGALARV